MFGIDSAEMKRIEARLDWLTKCGVILMLKLGELLHVEFPPPPEEPKP